MTAPTSTPTAAPTAGVDAEHTGRAFYLGEARRLLAAALDAPEIAAQIGDDAAFLDAGVNSGEIIRLLYRCEEYLNTEIGDDEMSAITSLRELAALLRRRQQDHHAGGGHVA